jgi:hypothetical protein
MLHNYCTRRLRRRAMTIGLTDVDRYIIYENGIFARAREEVDMSGIEVDSTDLFNSRS